MVGMAAVLLIGPTYAGSIITNSPTAYEGRDLTFKFKMSEPISRDMCYDYRTADGSATGSGWRKDYTHKQGSFCWESFDSGARMVTINTHSDSRFEPVETVKVVLSNPRYHTLVGWQKICGPSESLPCQDDRYRNHQG